MIVSLKITSRFSLKSSKAIALSDAAYFLLFFLYRLVIKVVDFRSGLQRLFCLEANSRNFNGIL